MYRMYSTCLFSFIFQGICCFPRHVRIHHNRSGLIPCLSDVYQRIRVFIRACALFLGSAQLLLIGAILANAKHSFSLVEWCEADQALSINIYIDLELPTSASAVEGFVQFQCDAPEFADQDVTLVLEQATRFCIAATYLGFQVHSNVWQSTAYLLSCSLFNTAQQ